jgi:ketosteroid isomerase-like protein
VRPGARTPEELETLFEDACVIRDSEALAQLFEDGALLLAGPGPQEARGAGEIAHVVAAMWKHDRTYLADPRRVLQARDTALVLAEQSINVMRRASDGTWRYAITFLDIHDTTPKEQR